MRDIVRQSFIAFSRPLEGPEAFADLVAPALSPEHLERLVLAKLDDLEILLAERFGNWASWPADAQLAMLSLTWVAGDGFGSPRFELACRSLAFDAVANECRIPDDRVSIERRNAANRTLFRNAGHVVRARLDPSVLYYPRDMRALSDRAITEPEFPAQKVPSSSAVKVAPPLDDE
ncbi:hypothetical protein AKJ09_11396 [Labilithrix luteola]|uniref:Uncharacterized protein n=1 Tax=Labilithrix luteola TaxID=1391654 RepID=A0A0K1QG97_9BACT|nr:hypothetical protein [Labilithrix luteola]AKV04733.1 hypothetical protein AKJ09_11396 [Labilithrix luteola]